MLKFEADKSERLDKFISEKVTQSRGRVQKAIKAEAVLVNGKKVLETDYPVKIGDVIELPEFESEELKPVNIKLKIVFENDDLAVLDKRAGIMVHPAAGRTNDTLSHALLAQFPQIKGVGDAHRPGIVH
ncbi:MAG TPA: S4 domain-containing protein, partial [Methylomirabilota bacterium]|nr:S4 domain-containing protein [Methylomirabilota bacterium]